MDRLFENRTSPRTTNHACSFPSDDSSSAMVILRSTPGLVMTVSTGLDISTLEVDSVVGSAEKSGCAGFRPSSFNLCIQPPGCVPATELMVSSGPGIKEWMRKLTSGMLELKLSIIQLVDAYAEPPDLELSALLQVAPRK